ncbi:terminase gpP N-terminus-related DNA-binding protein [Escherichia coli]|uniref:terminase gpP N-terminus-related DNA-binding protein n=1 Tax=Escherichia coli TaxID=562 RepID=UPI0026BF5727
MIQDAFVRQRARQLYWQGYPPAEISRLMGINPNTIYAWKKRDQWDETPPVQRVSSPSMRASSSLLKNRIKQAVTLRK